MSLTSTRNSYGAISRVFHWLMALLLLALFALGWGRSYLPPEWRSGAMALHRSLGITVLILGVARATWRFLDHGPLPSPDLAKMARRMAGGAHLFLYAFFLALPLSGWLMGSAFGQPVLWFGAVELPALLAKNRLLAVNIKEVHELAAYAFCTLIGVHIAAALYHRYVRRDSVLSRML